MKTSRLDIKTLLREAYQYWIKTLPFQFLFTLIYVTILLVVGSFAFRNYGLYDEVQKFQHLIYSDSKTFVSKYSTLLQTENALQFLQIMIILKAVIFPLNIGFLKIYRKMDLGESPKLNDIFAGYQGKNFFFFLLYSLFWTSISNLNLFFTLIWIPMMLFVPSLIFFKDYNYFQSFKISIQTFMKNIVLIFTATIICFLFSYSGSLVFFFGLLVTFPFWNAMIYVLYKHLIGDF